MGQNAPSTGQKVFLGDFLALEAPSVPRVGPGRWIGLDGHGWNLGPSGPEAGTELLRTDHGVARAFRCQVSERVSLLH